jgi:hypothetical protein
MKLPSQVAFIALLVSIAFTVACPVSAQVKCSIALGAAQKDVASYGIDPQLIIDRGYAPEVAERLVREYPDVAGRLLALSEADSAPFQLYRGEGVPVSEYPAYGTAPGPDPEEIFLAARILATAQDYASPTITELNNVDPKKKAFQGTVIKFALPTGWVKSMGNDNYYQILRTNVPNPLIFTTDVGTLYLPVKDAVINDRQSRVEWPTVKIKWHPFADFFGDDVKLKKLPKAPKKNKKSGS